MYVPEPPYCTYGLRVPASCVLYVPEAQGSLPRGQALLYVRRRRTSVRRAVRTAYRGNTGHLRECEVCHSPWTFGLPADAAPPSQEVADSVLAACQTAIRADDRAALRRRLSPHVMQTSGTELLLLAARTGRQGEP